MLPYRRSIEQLAGQKLDVIPNKSVHGLVALIQGRARLAMISSSLAGEIEHLKRKHPSLDTSRLKGFEIARTRIAFVTHPSVPVRRLSMQQMADVLSGRIKTWREIGGPDTAISVVTVQPGGGVPTTVRVRLLGGRSFSAPRIVVVEAPSHVLKITSQLEGALGITQLGLALQERLPELMLDEQIEQELNLVTLGEPTEDLAAVIKACRIVASQHLD